MADNKIGGLPVMDDGRLVGIITETDIFKILLELLGARTPGVRVIVVVQEAKGVLAQITRVLADLGREHRQRGDLRPARAPASRASCSSSATWPEPARRRVRAGRWTMDCRADAHP